MIVFENVVIKYGQFVAMNELNLTINKGEFFSFLGPSGSGKTTVLRALTGFTPTASGRILIEDTDVARLPIEKRNIGIVFQSYALFPTMNVYENIAYGLKVRKVAKEEIREQVTEMARMVDLSQDQLTKKVSELSGGQQQRVAIARALVIKPKILCLDEPLSNLDAKLRGKLRKELKTLQKELGITTIYVTHDQEEALTLSDRIAVFDNGCLQQVGAPETIYNEPQTEFVANFIGESNKIVSGELATLIGSGYNLSSEGMSYIHTNDISLQQEKGDIKIDGEIVDKDFFGYYIKYTLKTSNDLLLRFIVFTSKSAQNTLEIGAKVSVYVNPTSVFQF